MERSKLMMIIIIALLVLLLGTVVGVSVYVMNMIRSQTSLVESADNPIAQRWSLEDTTSIQLGDTPIVTNLARSESGGNHFIRVSAWVGFLNTEKKASDTLAATLEDNIHIARSIALACIKGSTYEELSDPEGKVNLENKILLRLQEEFESNLIVFVSMDDYLLQ
jgi:flagellar basal body-associated protein FliL